MNCTGIFFSWGWGKGWCWKDPSPFERLKTIGVDILTLPQREFLGAKVPENTTVKGEKKMIKVEKKKKPTFSFFILLFICCCWGLLLLPRYGTIIWLSRDVTVAKETAAILYQSNDPLAGMEFSSCAIIFVCGFGRKRWDSLKDCVLVRGHTCLRFSPSL